MKKIISTLIILCLFSVTSFAQWTQLTSPASGTLNGIYFTSASTGFITGWTNGIVYRTTNAGINWASVVTGTTNTLYEINFVNSQTGFVVGTSRQISKTTDGGLTWNLKYTASGTLYTIAFTSSAYFTGGSPSAYFMKSTDAGENWFIISQPTWLDISGLQFINDATGWLCGDGGVLLRTDNAAGSWWVPQYLTSAYSLDDVSFQSLNNGLICGNMGVMRSSNGGNNWLNVYNSAAYLYDMFMVNSNTGWASGANGLVVKTTDGGNNWTAQTTPVSATLYKVFMTDTSTGYIIGANGVILKTTNGGVTPPLYTISGTVKYQDNQQSVTSGYVKALRFNYSTGAMTTIDSAQIQSNGTYVLPHIPPDTVDVMAFENDEEELYFVPTYYPSTIFWENSVKLFPTGNLTNINIEVYRIINPGGQYHIGGGIYSGGEQDRGNLRDAIIYAKSGNVFKGYSMSLDNGMYRVDSLSSASYEIICNRMGYYSSIRPLQITTYSMDTIDFVLSNLLVKIENPGNIVPGKFTMYQNYPNPFNPSTKIKFDIPSSISPLEGGNLVRITIYDVLGKEIAMLVNEKLTPGTYEVTWNASDYPSGVYFYKLQTGNFIDTKKMVLIK